MFTCNFCFYYCKENYKLDSGYWKYVLKEFTDTSGKNIHKSVLDVQKASEITDFSNDYASV